MKSPWSSAHASRSADRVEIPIDAAGRMRVDFGVPRGRCGFDDLVLAAAQSEAKSETHLPPETFSGKLLLLSRVDAGSRTLRLAAGRAGSAGELFSAGIATIQSRTFIRRAPWWADAIVIGSADARELVAAALAQRGGGAPSIVALHGLRPGRALDFWLGSNLAANDVAGPRAFSAVYRLATPGTEGELQKAVKIRLGATGPPDPDCFAPSGLEIYCTGLRAAPSFLGLPWAGRFAGPLAFSSAARRQLTLSPITKRGRRFCRRALWPPCTQMRRALRQNQRCGR